MNDTAGHPPASSHAGTEPGMLSDDALAMLKFSGQPFAAEIVDGKWFSDDTTREQLVDIKEALINGDDLLLVSGVYGAGKSVLLKQLSTSGGTRIQCFSVRGSQRFSTFNLFSGMLEAFKLKPPAELKDTLKDVIPCLQALSERNMLGVIVLDDADNVGDHELSQLLGSIQYLNSGEDTLLRVLMAAEPEFESRIPELLPTSSDLPYASLSIEPFDIGRSTAYLGHRLSKVAEGKVAEGKVAEGKAAEGKVGDTNEFSFSENQLLSICESAQGLPSGLNIAASHEINNFCNATGNVSGIGKDIELIEVAPRLQSRPLKFALGIIGVGLILAAGYLFIEPQTLSARGDKYQVVSNEQLEPIAQLEPTAVIPEPERIALITETEQAKDDADTPSAGATAIANPPAEATQPAESVASDGEKTNSVTSPAAPVTQTEAGKREVSKTTMSQTAQAPATSNLTTPAVGAATPETNAALLPQATNAAAESTAGFDQQLPQTPSENASDLTPLSDQLLESANWVLVQDPALYTVQMSASQQRESVESFLRRSNINGPNSIFSFQRGERTWYALVHGLYPTITEARKAIDSMPAAAKTNQPWIRAIGQIQKAVKNQ